METTTNRIKLTQGTTKSGSNKRAYYLGVLGVVLTIAMAVAVVYYWKEMQSLQQWGYLGVFIISILGGATVLVPVPMLAVQFALGAVLKPEIGAFLGPIFVGLAAGLGETLGALTIYITGHGGGAVLANSRHGRIQAAYERLMCWMERRGSLTLFILSAIVNPFFYPAALSCGALRFGIKRYFFICWAGKTIKGFTVAFAGYWGLGSLLRLFGIPL